MLIIKQPIIFSNIREAGRGETENEAKTESFK